jgi:hypothetical protein
MKCNIVGVSVFGTLCFLRNSSNYFVSIRRRRATIQP